MGSIAENLKRLEKKIASRKAFLQSVLDFVQEFVRKHGRETKREECSDYCILEMELLNFNGFDIFWRLGRSNRIDMLFTPPGGARRTVFGMTYWHTGVDGCEVLTSNEESGWQKVFTQTAENADKIWAKMQAERLESKKAAETEQQKIKRLEDLEKEAKRLGLK